MDVYTFYLKTDFQKFY